MKKRLLTAIPVLLVVFLCSFPAYAVTGGGKTIVSSSYSYNNGAVSLYVRVNGNAGEENYTGGDRMYSYPHSFTVTLTNNSSDFQVADTNNFTIDLYTGSSTTFTSNQNSWGSEITSYSDNMTAPRVLMYPSGDLAGHVLISFSDSDLLVLNPNETRTYNFTINFIQYSNVNYTPLNGNVAYSYFTYTGTVGFYARPTSFSGNTIEDLINNNSLPNSVIAWEIAQYNQGIITNDELNDILDAIIYSGNYPNISSSSVGIHNSTITDNAINIYSMCYRGSPTYFDSQILLDSNTDTYYNFYSYRVPFTYYLNVTNNNNYPVKIYNNGARAGVNITCDSLYVIESYSGASDIYRTNATNISIRDIIVPANSRLYYVIFGYIPYNGTNPNYVYNIIDTLGLDGHFIQYDPYNSFNVLEEDAHTQEMNYYSQTNTALSNTGLSNFSFSPNVIGGLGIAKDHFTYVWNKLGVYKDVYIFSMTLAIALMIIRHIRPIRRKKEE